MTRDKARRGAAGSDGAVGVDESSDGWGYDIGIAVYHFETAMSAVAKVFTTGRSQAVRIPKDFRFASIAMK
ncbi:MAG: antitoxin [Panacagrimonas sp.]